jgi:hypothetical protein
VERVSYSRFGAILGFFRGVSGKYQGKGKIKYPKGRLRRQEIRNKSGKTMQKKGAFGRFLG